MGIQPESISAAFERSACKRLCAFSAIPAPSRPPRSKKAQRPPSDEQYCVHRLARLHRAGGADAPRSSRAGAGACRCGPRAPGGERGRGGDHRPGHPHTPPGPGRTDPGRGDHAGGDRGKASCGSGNIAMLVNETRWRARAGHPRRPWAPRTSGCAGDGRPVYAASRRQFAATAGRPPQDCRIPPTDLGQVEVIKGAASALPYGLSAVSRRRHQSRVAAPGEPRPRSSPMRRPATGRTRPPILLLGTVERLITGGAHLANASRPGRRRLARHSFLRALTARPRLFWEGERRCGVHNRRSAMSEGRQGGTLPGRTTPDGRLFSQAQSTDRFDADWLPRPRWSGSARCTCAHRG